MNKLLDYLKNRGIEHKFFAKQIGVSTTSLHNILKKGRIPNLETAIEIEKKTRGIVSVYDWHDSAENMETKKDQKNKK